MSDGIIDPKSIRVDTPDWKEGYEEGKKYARNKVRKLLDEVIEAYEDVAEQRHGNLPRSAQINAVKFAQIWVASGGQTDIDGNRACFPW